MTNLYARGGAYLLGVGITDPDVPDGSHFTMQQRWLDGDPAGEGKDTGVFGRLCDAVHNPDAMVTGCSVFAPSRSMLANQATTVSLPDPGAAWFLDPTSEDRFVQAYQGGLLALGRFSEADTGSFVAGRKGIRDAYGLGSLLFDLPDAYDQYPGDELGRSLAYAGRLIAADQGIRVIQVEFDGNFDSHGGHRGSHDGLMAGLDAALGVFFTDLDQRGMADRVLVMTTSEFGRRLDENASQGFDHGTASIGMMFGPVNPGVYGEPPSLTALTDEGELVATTSFATYYATAAAHWLGIDPTVVHRGATPIDGIVAA